MTGNHGTSLPRLGCYDRFDDEGQPSSPLDP